MKRFGVLLATVGGAGLFPIAPGTVGSAVGIVIYLATRSWPFSWQLGLAVAVSLVGTWAAGVAAKHYDREDPGQVVVDEVAGQLVTLLATGVNWPGALLGFLIFRVLDIIKPWPADRFERLPGGLGIMADDVMAGLYGCALVHVAVYFLPGVL